MPILSARSRSLTAAAALLLLALYVVPLWRIQLEAPQYPEGLGMLIRVNTITGLAPADLDNINGLNHYIGMKPIVPEAIPVLRFMPWVAGALALSGLLVALAGRRSLLIAWLASFAIAGVAGLVEFYTWSYDYGHNLAPDAVIKVPGMSYQPPLIGTKQLLNFTASSWPAAGGWLAGVAFGLALLALLPLKRGRLREAGRPVGRAATAAVAALILIVGGCSTGGPVPIAYGRADCDVCRMRISDERYGGEVVMRTGKVRQFDSIECLANYITSSRDGGHALSIWVSDYDRPGHLLPASEARFIRRQRSGSGSPMGMGLLAVGATSDPSKIRQRFGSAPLTWEELQALAANGALRPDHHPAGGGGAS